MISVLFVALKAGLEIEWAAVQMISVLFVALKAGLEIEWAAVEKPLRKAVKKYVQNVGDGDRRGAADEVLIAEDESVERYILHGIYVTLCFKYCLNATIHLSLVGIQRYNTVGLCLFAV